ncbi:unnamed protein product [Brugia pahangi]|uniref:G protein-coupled receptor n=1 Tax=Brugia pahangi TaxID=6280 RepID=A0A0N4THF2_BRUPA|nr:unnamed protein product [Brugia pahangi]
MFDSWKLNVSHDSDVGFRCYATVSGEILRFRILFYVVFFLFGWFFFMKQLFRDYEVHKRLVQILFSITFALSCTMFELIIFEIIGFLEPR